MGNFLVVVYSSPFRSEADRLFRTGLGVASYIKSQIPNGIVETEWAHAASFPRQNGSGTPIVKDPETESWLLTIGTWFHKDYGVGAESLLLSRYLEIGANRLAQELEGFFVIVIGDSRTRETIVITDIIGSCHCFYRKCKHAIAVSGSSLLLAGLEDFNLDPVACQEFLCTGTIYEERTVYQEVRKLRGATVFRFAGDGLKTEQLYWQITDLIPESLDGQSAVKALAETLTDAAKGVGKIFARPVCDLTGGYDSRVLVAAFLTAGVQVSTTVSGAEGTPDVVVSGGLAQVAGLPHIYLPRQETVSFQEIIGALPFTDGEFDLLEYARILRIHKYLSKHFDISINGSFGGVARAWRWELLVPRIGARCKLDSFKLAKSRYASNNFEPSLFPPGIRLELVSHFTDVIERINAGLSYLPNTMQMDHANIAMRIHRWQGRFASSTNQLWPCLSPFGLRSVLEAVLQTRSSLRLRSLLVRQFLAECQPELAEYPLDRGFPALPATWKNFHRFFPLASYFGKRFLSKGIRMAGAKWIPSSSSSDHLPGRLQLWKEEEVREFLHPAKMKLACLLDKSALAEFLRRSQEQRFSLNNQWARVLSLEIALRVLGSAKDRPVGGDQSSHE